MTAQATNETKPIMVGEGRQQTLSERILGWYQDGQFDVEVAANLEIPIREFYRKMDESAAFGRLIEYGRTLCEAYWVAQSRKLMKNKTMNAQPWVFVMKNKFNWADKSEQVETGTHSTANLDEVKQQLTKEIGKFIKQFQPELDEVERGLKLVGSDEDQNEV